MQDKFFTELSKFKTTEKVELALVDDFKKLFTEAKGADKFFETIEKVDLGIVQDLNKNINKSETLLKQSDKVIQKIDKAMKAYNDVWEATRVLNKEITDRIKSNNSAVSTAEQMAKKLGVSIKEIRKRIKRIKIPFN